MRLFLAALFLFLILWVVAWLNKPARSDAVADEIPVDPAAVPEDARRMFALIEAHKDHPLIKGHFFQVAIITVVAPDGGQATMYLPDFRDGLHAALFWNDSDGNWGSGGWIPVAHADADVTCPPSAFSVDYLQNNPAFPFAEAMMDHLYSLRPSVNV